MVVEMDVGDCVLSAGRAVLDMMEREWQQPLPESELEQRLDRAVEEHLEPEMLGRVRERLSAPPAVFLQLVGGRADTEDRDSDTGAKKPPQVFPQSMDEATVQHISDLLQTSESGARMTGRARLSLPSTVHLSLTLLSERASYRCVSDRFRLEKGNVHRIFFSFCERVNALREKLIRWPVGEEAEEALTPFSDLLENDQPEFGEALPRVLGVLGHSRIFFHPPEGKGREPEVKKMRSVAHLESWLNLELVCSRRGHILHCHVSKGSAVERGKAVRDRLQQHPDMMPSGSCLLAGVGYPLSTHILTPYVDAGGRREELFNETLQGHFRAFDRTVAGMKARFQRLRCLDTGSYERARAVVLAACVLHNVFVNLGYEVEGVLDEELPLTQEGGGGKLDDEGVCRRDAVADLLFKNVTRGKT